MIVMNEVFVTGGSIPKTLWKVHVIVQIEGVEEIQVLEPEENLKFSIRWDKRDVYGQKVYGRYVEEILLLKDCEQ